MEQSQENQEESYFNISSRGQIFINGRSFGGVTNFKQTVKTIKESEAFKLGLLAESTLQILNQAVDVVNRFSKDSKFKQKYCS